MRNNLHDKEIAVVSAKLKTQAKLPESPRPQTRKAARRPAHGLVVVRSSHGDRTTARLNDFSAFGCNLISDAAWLRMGGFIAIRLSDEVTVQAIVRWIRDGACGVEFLRPLPYSEADALGRNF
ncbi:PilZ domain-containing protein [Novosphingobium sp. B 225]|uniref:PilZ domain-containing protein n=1 Tax=Novosphingobium sp. B 225 TaxID=1961849 RepID=UPI000B4BDE5F|nr:PilZ domain-containing protein [Novosphingobium sp. B 225]